MSGPLAGKRIQTIEVAVDGRSESFTTTASLVAPPGVELVDRLTPVKVTIVPDEQERQVDAVPVAVRPVFGTGDLGDRFSVSPPTVQVILHGTRPEIDAALAQGIEAYVKVSPDDPGGRPMEVLVRAAGVGHQVDPPTVQLTRHPRSP